MPEGSSAPEAEIPAGIKSSVSEYVPTKSQLKPEKVTRRMKQWGATSREQMVGDYLRLAESHLNLWRDGFRPESEEQLTDISTEGKPAYVGLLPEVGTGQHHAAINESRMSQIEASNQAYAARKIDPRLWKYARERAKNGVQSSDEYAPGIGHFPAPPVPPEIMKESDFLSPIRSAVSRFLPGKKK